MISQILLYKRM